MPNQRKRRNARSLRAWLPNNAVAMIVSTTTISITATISPSRGCSIPTPTGAPSEAVAAPTDRQGTRVISDGMDVSMRRSSAGKKLRGMLAHPFGGRPRYPPPGGCGGDPSELVPVEPAPRLSGGTLTHLYAARARLLNFAGTMLPADPDASWDATPPVLGGRHACPSRGAGAQEGAQPPPPPSATSRRVVYEMTTSRSVSI